MSRNIEPISPFVTCCQKVIPLAFDESMSYYEALCALVNYLKNEVTPAVNENADAVTEMQIKFEELKKYVDDYFKNLDVQEEINNKLDDMAESGELADIIAGYIQLRGILAYDTVSELKNATNIVNGSFAETYGFYTKGDGGSAKYKIREVTNDDVIDEMFILEITSDPENKLVAELIKDSEISAKQVGIKGDGITNETEKIESLLTSNHPVYFPKGTYLISETISLAEQSVNVCGDGESTKFESYDTENVIFPLIDFSGCTNIYIEGLTTNTSSFKVYPANDGTYIQTMRNKNVTIKNLKCNTSNQSVSGKTNWNMFINNQAPSSYDRFSDGKYSEYPIEIVNHSGYNALMINNVCTNEEGTVQSVADNSAIGIIDKTLSSAPTIFIDQQSGRHPFAVKYSQASSQSAKYAGRVLDINQHGHIGIGTSCDNDDSTFTGSYTIKIKDAYPSIGMMRGTKALSISADADENLKVSRAGWESVIFTKYGMKIPTVTTAYYLPNLSTDSEFATVGTTWVGVMKYVSDTHKIAFWDGTNAWRDASGTVLKQF